MVRGFKNNKIQILNSKLVNMATLVEKQIKDSVLSLRNRDIELAEKIIKDDDKVDKLQRQIEEKCLKFMATESPLAIDLRYIYTTSKIVTDLERIADLAVDICKIVYRVKDVDFIDEITSLWDMVEIVISMIKTAIKSYINSDVKMAYEICSMDDKVDELYQGMFKIILKRMSNDGELINQGTQILFASKYIERVGDHVTNICEWIILYKNGEYVDLNE